MLISLLLQRDVSISESPRREIIHRPLGSSALWKLDPGGEVTNVLANGVVLRNDLDRLDLWEQVGHSLLGCLDLTQAQRLLWLVVHLGSPSLELPPTCTR